MKPCNSHNRCIDKAINEAELLSLKHKLKFTRLRKDVLKLIWQSHMPLKAYDILDLLQQDASGAKPITVYRTLDFLLENRMIHKIASQNAFLGCAHPGDEHNCYFIICNKCHVVKEGCEDTLLESIYSNLAKNKFQAQHVTLEIQGICKNCI